MSAIFQLLSVFGFLAGMVYAFQGEAGLCFGFMASSNFAGFMLGYIEGQREAP